MYSEKRGRQHSPGMYSRPHIPQRRYDVDFAPPITEKIPVFNIDSLSARSKLLVASATAKSIEKNSEKHNLTEITNKFISDNEAVIGKMHESVEVFHNTAPVEQLYSDFLKYMTSTVEKKIQFDYYEETKKIQEPLVREQLMKYRYVPTTIL